jgi:hypothetical protein
MAFSILHPTPLLRLLPRETSKYYSYDYCNLHHVVVVRLYCQQELLESSLSIQLKVGSAKIIRKLKIGGLSLLPGSY